MTLTQARALLVIQEVVTFNGMQVDLSDEDMTAWSELVTAAKKMVELDRLDRINSGKAPA